MNHKFSCSSCIVYLIFLSRESVYFGQQPESRSDSITPCGAGEMIDSISLKNMVPISIQEALDYVPGITGFQDDGIGISRINIGIRGLDPRRSSKVLLLEDGIPIKPAPYIFPNSFYTTPIERVERIEFTKSSTGVEFSTQSIGGVVNFKTGDPRENFGGRVQLTGGSNAYASSLVEVGGFGNARFRPELQLVYKGGDGFRDNNEFKQYHSSFKALFLPNDERRILLSVSAQYEEADATLTGLTEYSFENDYTFNPKRFDELTIQSYSLSLSQEHSYSPNFKEESLFYVQYMDIDWWQEDNIFGSFEDFDRRIIRRIPLSESGDFDDLIRIGNSVSNTAVLSSLITFGLEQKYTWNHQLKENIDGKLKIGGRLQFERFEDNQGVGAAPDARAGELSQAQNYETFSLALYVREEVKIKNLALSPGVRVELFEQEVVDRLNGNELLDQTNFEILPGLGINYTVANIDFFGAVHRGMPPPSSLSFQNFRANSIETDGESCEDIKPELSWTYELGFRTDQKYIEAEVAIFKLDIEDLTAVSPGLSLDNLGPVTSQGIEVGGTLKLRDFKSYLPNLFVCYTYLKTEINEGTLELSAFDPSISPDLSGNELPYAPRYNIMTGLTFNILERAQLMISYRYISESFSDFENIESTSNRGDTGPIPAFGLLNASVHFEISDKLKIFVDGKNILDEKYIGSRLHSDPRLQEANASSGILPGMERQINVGVNFIF